VRVTRRELADMEDDRSRAEQRISVRHRSCHDRNRCGIDSSPAGEQLKSALEDQLGFGPRITGTEGNRKCAEYLIERHAYRIFGLIHSADSKKTCSL
jgi:hypothetical protein